MHMTQGWTGLRTAVIALGIIAGSTTGAKADALADVQHCGIDRYVRRGHRRERDQLRPDATAGGAVTSTTVDASSNLPLGTFQVAALPANTTTTYNNTPFSITFLPSNYNGIALTDPSSLTITGVLNGQINGAYQSTVEATFNPIKSGSFELAGASSTLNILDSQKLLVPSSAGGSTTAEGVITTVGGGNESPVPEPSTIALFLSTVGGLGLRRFVLNRRSRTQA